MIGSSPLAPRKLKQLIFAGNVLSNQYAAEEDLDKFDEQRPQDGNPRPSAYVTVFEGISFFYISSIVECSIA